MLRYLIENIQFYLLLLLWLVVGAYGGPVIYLLLPFTVIILDRKQFYEEIFVGFWFILILSDNLLVPQLEFAKSVKNVYIVLICVLLLLRRKEFTPFNKYFLRFLPFFAVAFISLASTETFGISIQKTLSYILLFIAVPNYIERIYRENGEQFFKRLVYFFTGIIFLGLLLKFIDPSIGISHGNRLTGVFGNPNGLGIFCVLTFMLFFVITAHFPSLFARGTKLFIYLVIISSIILSGSRNAAVAICIFLFFSRFYKMSPFLGFILVALISLSVEVVGDNYIFIIKAMGLEHFFRLETLQEGAGRYVAWNFAWEQIQDNFFMGKGFAYDEYIMRKNYDLLSRLGHQGGVHNSYLILWLNTGLIGLLVYLGGFLGAFFKATRNTRHALPIMYTVMFTAMFEPWLVASLNPFTIVLLILVTIILNPAMRTIGAEHFSAEIQHS